MRRGRGDLIRALCYCCPRKLRPRDLSLKQQLWCFAVLVTPLNLRLLFGHLDHDVMGGFSSVMNIKYWYTTAVVPGTSGVQHSQPQQYVAYHLLNAGTGSLTAFVLLRLSWNESTRRRVKAGQ